MTPSHAVKGGVRYRYYISRAPTRSAAETAAATVRLPASDVEEVVLKALTRANGASPTIGATAAGPTADDPFAHRSTSIRTLVERINLRLNAIEIEVADDATDADRAKTIVVPWSKSPTRVQRDVISPANGEPADPRAMSLDTRCRLISAIAAARRWMDELAADKVESSLRHMRNQSPPTLDSRAPENGFSRRRPGRERRVQAGDVSISPLRRFLRPPVTDGQFDSFSKARARREFRTNGWWGR